MTDEIGSGYHRGVTPTDRLLDTLKELLTASNPGLVTREDMSRLQERLDEIIALVDEIEARLDDRDRQRSKGAAEPS